MAFIPFRSYVLSVSRGRNCWQHLRFEQRSFERKKMERELQRRPWSWTQNFRSRKIRTWFGQTFVGSLLVVTLLASFTLVPASIASASVQGSSTILKSFASQVLTGSEVTRYDSIPSNLSGTNCSTLQVFNTSSTTDQVDQVMVANIAGNDYYVEFGTTHQCGGYEWWYAEIEQNGTILHSWSKSITGSNQHTFAMYSSGTVWKFQIDSTIETSWTSGFVGNLVYDEIYSNNSGTGGTVTNYQDSALKYTANQGAWTAYGSPTVSTGNNNTCAVLASGSTTVYNMGDNVSNITTCT